MYACQRVGRASGLIYFFCVCGLLFSRSRGDVFWQISTIGGGALSRLCMSASREGELGESFFCASVVRFFSEWGGKGGAGFGGSLLSAAALLVYACKLCRLERMSVLSFYLFTCAFKFSLTRGRCFRGICTIGGGASGGFIPLRWEGKRAAPFPFALPPLKFHGLGERGGAGLGGSLPSAAALSVYACQRVGRASGLNFIFALAPLNFLGPSGGVFDGSLSSAGALLIYLCQRVGRANGVIFSFLCFR